MSSNPNDDDISCVLYERKGFVAYITLNRPRQMNAIDMRLPSQLEWAVQQADADQQVRVIVLQGAGRAFCAGYDLELFAARKCSNPGFQDPNVGPWDPMIDFRMMFGNTHNFMSLQRTLKPVICKVHGAGAIAGGSDIALCADIIVMSETARIGYPPARSWGCPTTMHWITRVGPVHAKRMLLTGDAIDGKEAFRIGLVNAVVAEADLEAEVERWVQRIGSVAASQLAMHKLVVNTATQQQGLYSQQVLATLLDGVARHSPDGVEFKRVAEAKGWKEAVAQRDGKQKAKL